MSRPTIGSPSSQPRPTKTALAITPRETKPSTRACFQRPQVRKLLRMQQALDRLVQGDARRDEDRKHHGVARPFFRTLAAQQKGGADRYRGESIACVVNQVGEQRDGAGKEEDHGLHGRRRAEHAETEQHRIDSSPRADD
jgi:hypothetical protein